MDAVKKEKDFFEEFGLQVSLGDVKIGETYPIFGMITKLIDETPGNIVAEINHSIRARMSIPDNTKLNVLKERAFETGIFISKVTQKEPGVEVDCQTVIFGKKQAFNA